MSLALYLQARFPGRKWVLLGAGILLAAAACEESPGSPGWN